MNSVLVIIIKQDCIWLEIEFVQHSLVISSTLVKAFNHLTCVNDVHSNK